MPSSRPAANSRTHSHIHTGSTDEYATSKAPSTAPTLPYVYGTKAREEGFVVVAVVMYGDKRVLHVPFCETSPSLGLIHWQTPAAIIVSNGVDINATHYGAS